MDTAKRFCLDNIGRLRLDDDRNTIKLSDLPEHICTQIRNFVIDKHDILRHATFVNLDKTVEISNVVAPMYINRELLRQFAGDLLRQCHTFTMRSTSARASFASTSKLEKFLNNDYIYTAQNHVSDHVVRWHCGRDSCFLTFILSIELDNAMQLDDLRVNILPFIIASL
jgi:hypothetical protein